MKDNSRNGNRPTKRPLRVGLIGVTGYAFAYFEELNKLVDKGLVQWGAATVINREEAVEPVAFLEASGVPIYDDYNRMLEAEADNLDWVCIPTAIAWHRRMTEKALGLGLPVLLEKPIAPTLQDVIAIQEAEQASSLPVAIGFQHNYISSTWDIKKRLLAGELGTIERIDGICLWPRPQSYYTRNNWGGLLHDGTSWVLDSPLHNALSHIVNLILFFSGKSLESRADMIRVEAELYRAKPIENYDTIRSMVQMDSGFPATVVLSHCSRETIHPEIRITGTEGTLLWRYGGSHTITKGDHVETLPEECQIKVRETMFENVVNLIQGDSSVRICTTEQAKGEVKWVNATQDAAVINEVPCEFRSQYVDADGEVYDTIEGLDAVAKKSYAENKCFQDLGVPWAVCPGVLDLSDYKAFTGRYVTVASG